MRRIIDSIKERKKEGESLGLMGASIEALAMAGVDYRESGIYLDEQEFNSIPPPYLLAVDDESCREMDDDNNDNDDNGEDDDGEEKRMEISLVLLWEKMVEFLVRRSCLFGYI